ncbi:unnamed protein product [Arctia plantaginis]|uniref:Caspase-8 n=1 Tax=Arctia plantaginis TaxID=874455 RepID=A0A8S0ZP02_ARCPL|nr:unnamed protein product [Arctia plantaginis]
MLRSDSQRAKFNPDTVISNNDDLNTDMISEIEKELHDNPYDVISLVFLLYDVPITALQRLIVFERVSKDSGSSTNLNMLHEWFRHAKHTTTWKHEFIEALLICQLNSVVRKLGFHVPTARNYYQIDNMQTKMFINPIKKALYKLCENMNADNFLNLKKALFTYNIDASEYESCELVLLKLMCDKFIIVNEFKYNTKTFGFQVQLDKLLRIIETLPGLRTCAQEIRLMQQSFNGDSKPSAPSTPSVNMKVDESNQSSSTNNSHLYCNDFKEVFGMIGELSLEDNSNIKSLKSDTTKLEKDSFEIKNPKRVGVCVILNQMNFYPSKNSIENNQSNTLAKRNGSDKDQAVIESTMKALNFVVYSAKDLNHRQMFYYLKEILKTKVFEDDTVFMLCILSHGVKGHVYASDSVQVNMDDIQKLLESDVAVHLHGKPKLLIIQACQVDETPKTRLVADNLGLSYAFKKTNFLIFWATAPELEAFRDESQGSIFIQRLCHIILEYANKEHISDIFIKVTDDVSVICENLNCKQVPIYHSTLRKKLYLRMAE